MKRIALIASCCWLVSASAIASETGPVIVIPGKLGVPIIINGVDVSYAVIEGDWGLARPSYTAPTFIYRNFYPTEVGPPPAAGYFPKTGRAPRLGRLERDVPRPPERPRSYNRGWGIESAPTPATIPSEYPTPPIIVNPDLRRRRHHP